MVHIKTSLQDNVDAALAASDGFAVLGVFFQLGKFDNPILEPIINHLSEVVTAGEWSSL